MSIRNWPEGLRPREKLLKNGAASLSNEELLALFLRTGLPGLSAVELGHQLLQHFGSLRKLLEADASTCCALPGIGPARYAQLQAATELVKRTLSEKMFQSHALSSPYAVREYLKVLLSTREYEVFVVVFLNAQHYVIRAEEMFRGTLTQTSVHPREIVKRALMLNAGAVILAHNHPSGVKEPSQADKLLTDTLMKTLRLIDVKVLDHFIIAGESALSFAEEGLLSP